MKIARKCRTCIVARRLAGCLFGCSKAERAMRELDVAMRDEATVTDPIMEQLRQCPEAFRAGELVGKLFDALTHDQEASVGDDRYLPPQGSVLPPLV
jgi:hypothetical protein